VTLVVHALVLINIDSNMHGDEIKIYYTYAFVELVKLVVGCCTDGSTVTFIAGDGRNVWRSGRIVASSAF